MAEGVCVFVKEVSMEHDFVRRCVRIRLEAIVMNETLMRPGEGPGEVLQRLLWRGDPLWLTEIPRDVPPPPPQEPAEPPPCAEDGPRRIILEG